MQDDATTYPCAGQAVEVSSQVKALAEMLSTRGKGNDYQGVFCELYRRCDVEEGPLEWER